MTRPIRQLHGCLLVVAAVLLAACGGSRERALVLRPGATPAPVDQTRSDPVERPHYHYFGEVPMGEIVRHTFVFDNTSAAPVSILRALPSCGCLELEVLTRDATGMVQDRLADGGSKAAVVPPGGTLDVEFVVYTKLVREPNLPRLLMADVQTDDPRAHILRLEGTITARSVFQMLPDQLEFGTIAHTSFERRRATISQAGPHEDRLALTGVVVEQPEGWLVGIGEERLDEGLPRTWVVDVTVPAGGDETFQATLLLATSTADGTPGPPHEIRVRGRRGEEYYAAPNTIYFRGERVEASPVRVAARIDVSAIDIARVEVEGQLAGRLEVDVTPGPPLRGSPKTWNLVARITSGAPAEASGRVLVWFTDPDTAPLAVPYFRFP